MDWGRRDAAILGLLAAVAVAGYAAAFAPFASPWIGDAPYYVEAARSLLRVEPLLTSFDLEPPAPMRLWPPGFSAMIAAVAATGVPVLAAAHLLTCAAVAAIAPAAYWALAPWAGRLVAALGAVLCVSSLGVLGYANAVGTEPVFLVPAVLALGFIARGRYLAAGLCLGLSLLIRNTGLALLPALAAGIALDGARPRDGARAALGMAGPVAVLAGWNLAALGTLAPYAMAPSTRELAAILGDMAQALVMAAVPSVSLARAVPWPVVLAIVVALCGAGLAWATLGKADAARRRGVAAAAAFVLAGVAMTVLGRLRYEWGAEISVRHGSQYEWLLLPLAAALLPGRRAVVAAGVIAVALFGLRMVELGQRHAMLRRTDLLVAGAVATGVLDRVPELRHVQTRQFFRHYEAVAALPRVARAVAGGCLLVSDLYEVLLVQYDLRAVRPQVPVPAGRDFVAIEAVLTPGEAPRAPLPADRLRTVAVAGLPAGLRVLSSDPARCLPSLAG